MKYFRFRDKTYDFTCFFVCVCVLRFLIFIIFAQLHAYIFHTCSIICHVLWQNVTKCHIFKLYKFLSQCHETMFLNMKECSNHFPWHFIHKYLCTPSLKTIDVKNIKQISKYKKIYIYNHNRSHNFGWSIFFVIQTFQKYQTFSN